MNRVDVVFTHQGSFDLTKHFMQFSHNADVFLSSKFTEIFKNTPKKKTNPLTKCLRYRWDDITDEQKGIIQGCLLVIPTTDYIYQDFTNQLSFGELTESIHQIKD